MNSMPLFFLGFRTTVEKKKNLTMFSFPQLSDVISRSSVIPFFSAPTSTRRRNFFNEVPMDLLETRRSSRGKGGYGGDDKVPKNHSMAGQGFCTTDF